MGRVLGREREDEVGSGTGKERCRSKEITDCIRGLTEIGIGG
jgi:hypothetical protein